MIDGWKKRNTSVLKSKSQLKNDDEDEDEEEEVVEGPTLESQFIAFTKFGYPDDPGTHIRLHQINAWMKQAGLLRVRQITRTDTGVCYFHFKKCKLSFQEYNEFLELLSVRKKIPIKEIVDNLVLCGLPHEQ